MKRIFSLFLIDVFRFAYVNLQKKVNIVKQIIVVDNFSRPINRNIKHEVFILLQIHTIFKSVHRNLRKSDKIIAFFS